MNPYNEIPNYLFVRDPGHFLKLSDERGAYVGGSRQIDASDEMVASGTLRSINAIESGWKWVSKQFRR